MVMVDMVVDMVGMVAMVVRAMVDMVAIVGMVERVTVDMVDKNMMDMEATVMDAKPMATSPTAAMDTRIMVTRTVMEDMVTRTAMVDTTVMEDMVAMDLAAMVVMDMVVDMVDMVTKFLKVMPHTPLISSYDTCLSPSYYDFFFQVNLLSSRSSFLYGRINFISNPLGMCYCSQGIAHTAAAISDASQDVPQQTNVFIMNIPCLAKINLITMMLCHFYSNSHFAAHAHSSD